MHADPMVTGFTIRRGQGSRYMVGPSYYSLVVATRCAHRIQKMSFPQLTCARPQDPTQL